ncbi:beta-ketoacyl-ACP synthase 3 [Brevundimonas sp.]|uniref:beta-ketoacyl-ACP synthase 3 n=1 Tax=Brevundimonas sp. TaxID=1871086 RepID=UPI0025F7530D|nr:beta-ketoacyl-ACP synthase 3 [Brevundimonas sp.]
MARIGPRIAGLGVFLPERRLSSSELDARIGQAEGWIEANFRIRERRVASPEETSSRMGAQAARRALAAAGLAPADLDVLVGACGVMEQPIPGTAVLIQHELGLGASGMPAFDVNATCLSFLTALDVVAMGVRAGRWRRALIVSADIASAGLDFSDPQGSVIFGDGAAAAVITADETGSDLLAYRLETYSEGRDLCVLEAGGTRVRPETDMEAFLKATRFRMDGPGVFRAAGRRVPAFVDRVLAEAGVSRDEIALVVPHQASAHALDVLPRLVGFDRDRFVDILADHGNQIAASLPTALARAVEAGRLKRGDLVLLLGTAAGLSLGAAVVRY